MIRHAEHVVVGLDDSDGGRAALRFALEDGVRRDARVDVVTVFRTTGPPPVLGGRPPEWSRTEATASVRATASAMVEDALAEFGPSFVPPPVTVLAVGGDAGEVLVHAAGHAGLLVVGSRRRGRVAGAMLGSVSLHCVQYATCPVTVVHPAP